VTSDDRTCARHPDSPYVELAVEVFTMLADATRVRLILALREGEQSVNSLAEQVDKSPTAVSQHLAKLRLARIVTTRQEGTRVFYRLSDEHAVAIVDEALKQAEHAIGAPHHHE
jgi:DNA-binding transcriptional ArsR family regulator